MPNSYGGSCGNFFQPILLSTLQEEFTSEELIVVRDIKKDMANG
jgi:hypothetical protein